MLYTRDEIEVGQRKWSQVRIVVSVPGVGNNTGTGGVAKPLAEKWIKEDASKGNDRIIII